MPHNKGQSNVIRSENYKRAARKASCMVPDSTYFKSKFMLFIHPQRNCFKTGTENTTIDMYTKFRIYICFPSELRGPERMPT